MGSSFHGSHSHRNLVPSSHNDTRDGLSANNMTMSIHGGGGHQSAIEYNELLERFEEVPLDSEGRLFRGSFPNEDAAWQSNGFDVPKYQSNTNQSTSAANNTLPNNKKTSGKTLTSKRSLSKAADPESAAGLAHNKDGGLGGHTGAQQQTASSDGRTHSQDGYQDAAQQKSPRQYRPTK